MKSLFTFYTAIVLWAMASVFAQAQNENSSSSIKQLNNLKEQTIANEKQALMTEVESINSRLRSETITEGEAEILKKSAAEKHALNIENRVAIIDNKIALIERNGELDPKEPNNYIAISFGDENLDNTRVFGVSLKSNKKDVVYDRRTTSGGVFAFGLNNVITDGESLENSDFKIAGSRFTEIGWAWKTRVFENTNWLRIKYGVSFQFNSLKPTDNRFFVDTGEKTELQNYPTSLKKSKFRMDNLVIPIHFEFGPSKKIEHEDYFRYATHSQVKFGIGAYGGINLGARQKLKFKDDGENQKQKLKANYNTNNFIYGLSAYVGYGSASLYAKYDLNTMFKNNSVDQRNVSLGLRLDLD